MYICTNSGKILSGGIWNELQKFLLPIFRKSLMAPILRVIRNDPGFSEMSAANYQDGVTYMNTVLFLNSG